MHTDASRSGLGAVLNVRRNGEDLPVAFFSRQLRPAERNYSVTELEALGAVAAIDHWLHWLYGTKFEVVTDHKALCSLLSSPRLNKRLRAYALHLQQFNVTFIYRPGDSNANADGLSRQSWEETESEKERMEPGPQLLINEQITDETDDQEGKIEKQEMESDQIKLPGKDRNKDQDKDQDKDQGPLLDRVAPFSGLTLGGGDVGPERRLSFK